MSHPPLPARPIHARDLSDYPNVYNAAFSWDRAQEADTFLRVAAARIGRVPRSAAELACGTGPLARIWASDGIESYGVDHSAPALAMGRRLDRMTSTPVLWRLGELRNFRLPRRVELAVVPLDGLGYLVDERDLVSFFRAAHRCLTPRGVLAADLTLHSAIRPPLRIRSSWKVSLRPQGELSVSWRSQGGPWGSPARQWEVGRFTVRIPGRPPQVFWEAAPHAALDVTSLRNLARKAGGFGAMWVYSDAAHRGSSRRIHRVESLHGAVGSRLVCWQRT